MPITFEAFNLLKVLLWSTLGFAVAMAWTPLLTGWLYKNQMWRKKVRDKTPDGYVPTEFQKLHKDKEVNTPRLGGLPELLDPDGAAPSSGLSRVPGGWLYGQRDTLPEDSELAEALLTSGHPATSSVEVPDMEKHAALVERVYRTALRERRGKKDANEAVS